MRRIAIAFVVLALAAGPALAQQRRGPPAAPPKPEDIQKKKEREAIDAEYRKALKRTKAPESAKVDPWANMRGEDQKK